MAPKQLEKVKNPPMASSSEEEEEESGSLGEEEEESGSLGEEANSSGDESDSPVLEKSQNRAVSTSKPESAVLKSKTTTKSSDVAALPESSTAKLSLEKTDAVSKKKVKKTKGALEKSQNRAVSKSKPESSVLKSKTTTKTCDVVASLPEGSTVKRPLEKTEEVSKKKLKKTSTGEEQVKASVSGDKTPKQMLIQRIFTEEDKIVLLQGILDFIAKNAQLSEDMVAFHEFVKDSLSFDATVSQLKTKVCNLKTKFTKAVKNSLEKGITEEDQIVFSKVYDQRCFDLSKKIWGIKGVLPSRASKKNEGKLKVEEEEEEAVLPSGREIASFLKEDNVTFFCLDESTLIAGWNMVEDGPKKIELEEKLKKIKAIQAELYLKRIELANDTAKMMFRDGASSSGK